LGEQPLRNTWKGKRFSMRPEVRLTRAGGILTPAVKGKRAERRRRRLDKSNDESGERGKSDWGRYTKSSKAELSEIGNRSDSRKTKGKDEERERDRFKYKRTPERGSKKKMRKKRGDLARQSPSLNLQSI